jgi:hypothetical protein
VDAFDPRECAELRALAADTGDLRLVDVLKAQDVTHRAHATQPAPKSQACTFGAFLRD